MSRLLDRDRNTWELIGREDPLWGVLSSDEYRHGGGNVDEFFAFGEREVAEAFEILGRHGITPATGAALDFGCGVGRLTRALASRFDRAVGVDISSSMIAEARRLNEGMEHLDFRVNTAGDLAQFPDASFDFVLSLIALQHVGSRDQSLAYVGEFLRVLKPGGAAFFQIPHAVTPLMRYNPLYLLGALSPTPLLERIPLLQGYAMRVTPVPEPAVRAYVDGKGGTVHDAFEDGRTGSPKVPSRAYVVTRAA